MTISILFACRNFHQMAGGVERMATLIMNTMVKRGFRIGLVTWDGTDAVPHYPLDSRIHWVKLAAGNPDKIAGWRIRALRQQKLRHVAKQFRPNVAIGFQVGTYIALRTATLAMGIPCIAAERNSPDLFHFMDSGQDHRKRADLMLRTADTITIQLESYRQKYPQSLHSRIVTIPNPVQRCPSPIFPNQSNTPPKRILHVGRFSRQKNQPFLIDAFSRIAKSHPNWTLTLVGDGPERPQLENLIKKHELNDQVELIGAVKDVDQWYAQSAFLAFPSLWEGFPNALVEAFRQGVPAIGLSETAGVNELITDYSTGLLSESNEKSFAEGMEKLIDRLDLRQQMGQAAHHSIRPYNPPVIFDKWADLFEKVAHRKMS